MSTADRATGSQTMTESESWARLREVVVGRLAVIVEGRPEIFPVNYVVDHGSVVIRTAEGTKLSASIGRPVAFEADWFDPRDGAAWSVVLKGVAEEVERLHELIDAVLLPLSPWHAATAQRIIRLQPDVVSGRRFAASDKAL